MAFSDTCIEAIVELSTNLIHYGKQGNLASVLPLAVKVIHDLAEIASNLDQPAIPGMNLGQRLHDGYFVGNLLDAIGDPDDFEAVQFLANAAKVVPVLADALRRQETMLNSKAGVFYTVKQPKQAATLQKVLAAFNADSPAEDKV
jgi:hypothetical protein